MALPVNINELLNGKTVEWDRLEFKRGWNPEDVCHTMCAFANDINNWGGGYIILGVDAPNGVPDMPPVGIQPSQIDSIQKELLRISYLVQPHYSPVTAPVEYSGSLLFVIWIPGGDLRPYKAPVSLKEKSPKEYYIRKGSSTVIARNQDERRLMELANKIPFDDRINHQADIDDLSLSLILGFLDHVKSNLYDEATRIPFSDLCRQMKIIGGTPEYLKPLNVGLLLFCENVQKYFRGARIDVVIRADESGRNFIEKKFDGPIQVQLTNALSFLKTNVIQEYVKKIPEQPEALRFFNYPYEAIEEILANAIYHRGYDNDNPVEVNVFPDRIEVLSFPGPLPPMTKQSLKQRTIIARDYRNRRIGDFLKELKLTEGRSTGFPAIYDSMEKNGSPDPSFETDDDLTYFLATLPIHPLSDGFIKIIRETYPEETLKELEKSTQKGKVTIGAGMKKKGSEKSTQKIPQKTPQKIMDLIEQNPQITREIMAIKLGLSDSAIAKNLRKLQKEGKLKRVGPDKGGHWEVISKN